MYAYGQTGSGKSYSMFGSNSNKGIITNIGEELFLRIKQNSTLNKKYEVCASILEINNENLNDLLKSTTSNNSTNLHNTNLILRESKSYGFYAEGLTNYPITSINEFNCIVIKYKSSNI